MFWQKENTLPGKRALCRHQQLWPAVTSFFRFPLPTSSLMQLLIFPSCPVRAEYSGILSLLVVSSGPPALQSSPTTNLVTFQSEGSTELKCVSGKSYLDKVLAF